MDVQTVVVWTNPALQSPLTRPQIALRSLLWSSICELFGSIFRPKEADEVEQLRKELQVTKTKNECLEQELNRKKEDHQRQKDQLNSFFFLHIKNREQSIDTFQRDCRKELDALFQRHDALKRGHTHLTEASGNLQRNIITLEHELAIVREANADLLRDNEKLSVEQTNLLEKRKRDNPLLQNALQDSGFVKFAKLG